MKRRALLIFVLLVITAGTAAGQQPRVLVYTRNYTPDGKGYVHDNLAASVAAVKNLGAANGFLVEVSDDPRVFADANLKQYQALVFCNSNNEAFQNDSQREAFQRYIQSGGGLVGIHSASGSERNWPYFQAALGGKFLRHPKLQKFIVRVQDADHPATRDIPARFEWEDECYFHQNLNPDMKVLLVTDPSRLDDPAKGESGGARPAALLPLAWYQTYDGGREFYVALGHKKEHYADPILTHIILGGIQWAMGRQK